MNAAQARTEAAVPEDPCVRDLLEAIEILREARRESSAGASATPYAMLYRAQMYLDRALHDHFTGGRADDRSRNARQD